MSKSYSEITKRVSNNMKVLRECVSTTILVLCALVKTTMNKTSLTYVGDAIRAYEQFSKTKRS